MNKYNLLIISLFFSINVLSDEYTDALEAEALGVEVENKTGNRKSQPNDKDGWSPNIQSISDNLTRNLDHSQFEEKLKESYFGTYIFYKKLTKKQNDNIFEMYQNGAKIEEIRDYVMTHYRERIRR